MIRKYEQKDREVVRKIVFDCAFMGEPASVFFEGQEVLSDALTRYFTDYEPQSTFVAESNSQVIGCLTGAKSKVVSEKIIRAKIVPSLMLQAFATGVILSAKNRIFFFNLVSGMVKGEFNSPSFTDEYPATFHINIIKGFRNQKIGARLIATFLDYLKEENIPGVHIATMSDAAGEFFAAQNFQLLYTATRSYFKHILHKNIPIYIYGKKT